MGACRVGFMASSGLVRAQGKIFASVLVGITWRNTWGVRNTQNCNMSKSKDNVILSYQYV